MLSPLLFLTLLLAQSNERSPANPVPPIPSGATLPNEAARPEKGAETLERQREGTKIAGQVGQFKMTGDRLTFYAQNPQQQPLQVLENLGLERVSRMMTEKGGTLEWTIDGTLTEYQGVNFLLLTRATVKSGANKP